MEEKKLQDLMERACAAVRKELGDEFEKLGYIVVVRTREAGDGFYVIGSDVDNNDLIAHTLHIAGTMVARNPTRLVRTKKNKGNMH